MSLPQFLAAAALIVTCGCRTGASVNVWQPPILESAVGKRVAIGPVVGPKEVSVPIRDAMLKQAPSDVGRALKAVDPDKLDHSETIRLVSGTNDVNDIALSSAARRESVDYILRGQVLSRRTTTDTDGDGQSDFDPTVPLAISWRLMSVADDRHAGGAPVIVDVESAIETYPDLAIVGDPAAQLSIASVRDAYRLVTPSIVRDQVQLANPYMIPGSRETRRGNVLAAKGNWGEAQRVWQAVVDDHPTQVAALHNLAIAAAAGQDFSRAKELVRKAIRRQPTGLNKQTLVWIEQQQRKYHAAFNLPDPPEGWFVTRTAAESE